MHLLFDIYSIIFVITVKLYRQLSSLISKGFSLLSFFLITYLDEIKQSLI